MNLFDRYLFKSVLFSCAASVAVFGFVLMLGNVVRDILPYVLAGQIGAALVVRLTLLLVPFVISFALPMGTLTGVLLTLGRLSADGEITALRAAGVSVARIARPVLLLGAAGAAAGLYLNFKSMPWSRVEYDREWSAVVRANPLSFLVPKTFVRNFPGYVVYIGDKRGPLLRDFWLWQVDDQQRVVRLYRAESGRLDYDEAGNSLDLTLENAKVESLDPARPEDFSVHPPDPSVGRTDPIRLSLSHIFLQAPGRHKPQWMTYAELQAARAAVAAAAAGRAPLPPAYFEQVDQPRGPKELLHAAMRLAFTTQDKINTALAVLTFVLVGVPLGIKVSRRETSANLGLAVALALGYYFLTVMAGWLDPHPEYRPDLLVWIPNLIMAGLGLRMLRRLDRTA